MVEPTVLPVVRVERLTLQDEEIARLRAALKASEALKGSYLNELERWRATEPEKGWPAYAGRLKGENEILELQNSRLRAALARIADGDTYHDGAAKFMKIARNALSPPDESQGVIMSEGTDDGW